MFTPDDRDRTLARVVELLSGDERIEATVLTGSLGAGRGDRWSDFDLDAVVREGVDHAAVAAEWEELVYGELPVAHHYTHEFGSTLVRGFLLRNGLLVDLAFEPIAEFAAWAPVKVLFDRTGRATSVAERWEAWSPTPDWRGEAGFAAHDVLHALVAANRGRPWQALYFLQRIRNRTLSLASERHGHDAQDFTRVDDLPTDEVDHLRASLVADLERDTLIEAIEAATRGFLTELARGDS